MAKQTFTTGQVLTAAQMTSLQQTAMLGGAASAKVASYVLVAADAGDAITMSNVGATTITANTGLFATGDIVTIINIGAGVCTVTAGTATITTSGSLVLAQNQGGVLRFTSPSAAIFLQFATPGSGDIEGVTAGIGISGGGTSGTVTVTNSMATAIDAKGDLVAGTGADAFARLAVGTNGQVLTANSATATGLEFATVASGGMTLLASGTLSGTTVSLTSINQGFKNLIIYMRDVTGTAVNEVSLQFNSNFGVCLSVEERNLGGTYQVQARNVHPIFQNIAITNTKAHAFVFIPDYTSSSVALASSLSFVSSGGNTYLGVRSAFTGTTTAITSVQLQANSGFSGGTFELFGQK